MCRNRYTKYLEDDDDYPYEQIDAEPKHWFYIAFVIFIILGTIWMFHR